MSKLVRKILAPLALMGALAATPAAAQGVSFSAGIGGFSGSEKAMQDIYGLMFKVRGTVDIPLSKSFMLEAGISYMSKDGKPYTSGSVTNAKANINFLQGEALGILTVPNSLGILRIGAGVITTTVTEKVSGNVNGQVIGASGSVSGSGLIGLLGVEGPMDSKFTVYADLSVSYIPFKRVSGKDVNLGGTSFDLGLKARL